MAAAAAHTHDLLGARPAIATWASQAIMQHAPDFQTPLIGQVLGLATVPSASGASNCAEVRVVGTVSGSSSVRAATTPPTTPTSFLKTPTFLQLSRVPAEGTILRTALWALVFAVHSCIPLK